MMMTRTNEEDDDRHQELYRNLLEEEKIYDKSFLEEGEG